MLAEKEIEIVSATKTAASANTAMLKTMVYKTNSGFVAECLDLDIAVREKTEKKAVRSLSNAVGAYLKTVADGDPSGLVPRRAPWAHYLRFYMFKALIKLPRSRVSEVGTRPFAVPSNCYSH